MVKVRVPATSANIGPGFDSMGIALGLYNYVTVEETDTGRLVIDILDSSKKFLPDNKDNLIYKSMKRVFDMVGYTPKGLKLTLENNIMITRGLGSSSAGIVGGIVAANKLSGNKLSVNEMLKLAADIEGHPDNVTPALVGGFTVNVQTKYAIRYVKTDLSTDDLRFAALVPDFFLRTKRSRGVLPKSVPLRDAVYNTGHSALLTASLMSGKYENIRTAVGDKLHQNYRKRLIPNMDSLFRLCYDNNALGVYLSGAGPTIIAIIRADNKMFGCNISRILTGRLKDWKLHILKPDNDGACIIESN
ncbi:MAG: homoserine kinase [Clostridiales bacterium]|nr:homoserine kinase [Clostridiales bacterium]